MFHHLSRSVRWGGGGWSALPEVYDTMKIYGTMTINVLFLYMHDLRKVSFGGNSGVGIVNSKSHSKHY